MKYTVIIPVYNGQDTIEQCLISLMNQHEVVYNRDYTVIVVDDGSTDNTLNIVRRFPVHIIALPENQGRIRARLAGVRYANTKRILLVDSRVTLPDHTIRTLDDFDAYPAINGDIDQTDTKYDTIFHTVFYLVRRRYYGKDYFPMRSEELIINQKNFKRAPKGTTLLLIDRDLFIELTPERTGKDVSDDTLLFHNLVFKHGLSLLRSRKISIRYSLRTNLRQFASWLSHRGVLFSDYYLRPEGYFFVPFLIMTIVAMSGVAAAMLVSGGLYYLLISTLALNTALTLYLSENKRDLLRVFFGLPIIVSIFASGVATYWVRKLRSAFSTQRSCRKA